MRKTDEQAVEHIAVEFNREATDERNDRDVTPPIDDSMCSDKDEVWSTPPPPDKSTSVPNQVTYYMMNSRYATAPAPVGVPSQPHGLKYHSLEGPYSSKNYLINTLTFPEFFVNLGNYADLVLNI